MESFEVGGRRWRLIEHQTMECYLACWPVVVDHRLDELVMLQDESPEHFAHRILAEIIKTGAAFDLWGCWCIPDELKDLEWSPAVQKATAEFFKLLQDPAEQEKAQPRLVTGLVNFVMAGIASFEGSPAFLRIVRDEPGPTRPATSAAPSAPPS